jgi:TPR repeat protein
MRYVRTFFVIASLVMMLIDSIDGFAQGSDRERLWREVQDARAVNDDVKLTVAYDQLVRVYNDPLAMNSLALHYLSGDGVSRNVSLALTLLQRSIQFGLERYEFGSNERNMAYRGSAATTLGFTYLTGKAPEIQPDPKLALEWNIRGAKLGHTNAYSNLALIYTMGFGVDKNYAATVSNLIRSVETYNDHHAWLLRNPDEWKDLVKDAPPEVWRARQLYWTALKTGDKRSSIREMRQLEAKLSGRGAPAKRRPSTSENIVKGCLSRGLKPGTQMFSACIAGD